MRYESPRAVAPQRTGRVARDGFELHWELYGSTGPAVLLLPPWNLLHSRVWKLQIPYLSRHARVILFDPPGNGLSDRPRDAAVYTEHAAAEDAVAVLDAAGVPEAVVAGLSRGVQRALILAAEHPDRVRSLILLSPMFPVSRRNLSWMVFVHPKTNRWIRWRGRPVSWAKLNTRYWRRDFGDFTRWFIGRRMFSQPFSGRVIEETLSYTDTADMDALVASVRRGFMDPRREAQLALAREVRCPVLVIQGDQDRVAPFADGRILAEATGGRLHRVVGGEHGLIGRRPVEVDLAMREFIEQTAPSPDSGSSTPPAAAPIGSTPPRAAKSVLWWSSPLGLGHIRRDLEIARQLRSLRPGTRISWLAEEPVRTVLEREGEHIHPASLQMPSECAGFEGQAEGHRLHAMEAWRALNEVALAEFMVFSDLVARERFDLWVGDEAWALDYHLHENPSQKRAAYAWLSDFVGYVPVPEDGAEERAHGEEFNAQMLEHVECRRVRDLSLFIGEPADIVEQRFAPGLPRMRDWAQARFGFSGYAAGFDPASLPDREELRAQLGWAPGEKVVLVAVGGSGVGGALLRRGIAALSPLRERLGDVRLVAVAGPRIDTGDVPRQPGLEVHGYVPDLPRLAAACDAALVQGGLSTCMELAATRTPFVYVPIQEHFEQQVHVPFRLERHNAGHRLDFSDAEPDGIAAAVAQELARPQDAVKPPPRDSARRAAEQLAQLL